MAKDTSRDTSAHETNRREDYKAYAERDVESGWPYSDAPGREQDRLDDNRPYAIDQIDEGENPDVETVATVPDDDSTADNEAGTDETVEDYLRHPPTEDDDK